MFINQSTIPPGLCSLPPQRWHPVPPPPPPHHYGEVGYVEWWDRGWRITCFRLELLLVTNGSTTMTCLERNEKKGNKRGNMRGNKRENKWRWRGKGQHRVRYTLAHYQHSYTPPTLPPAIPVSFCSYDVVHAACLIIQFLGIIERSYHVFVACRSL